MLFNNTSVFALKTEDVATKDSILEKLIANEEKKTGSEISEEKKNILNEQARRAAKWSIKSEYEKFSLENLMTLENYNLEIEKQADELYAKLCVITENFKSSNIHLKIGYFSEQYDWFCQNYINPIFFNKPLILKKVQFEELDDNYVEMFRGFNAETREQLDSFWQNFKYGSFFTGHEKTGAYCCGDFSFCRKAFAFVSHYGRIAPFGAIMRFCYNKNDVKIICEHNLNEIVKKYYEKYSVTLNGKNGEDKKIFDLLQCCFIIKEGDYEGPLALAYLAQRAVAARVLGFDIIKYDESPTCLKTGVLNRNKIIVQEELVEVYKECQIIS